jgi:hypothetical protein
MKARHRMPTIFSIYMVDVLCCALGCVILLWLINFREARQRAAAASEATLKLNETQTALDLSSSELSALRLALSESKKRESAFRGRLKILGLERDELDRLLALARLEKLETAKDLKLSLKELAELKLDFKTLQSKAAQATADLAAKTAALAELAKKIAAAELKVASLEKDLAGKTLRLRDADLASGKLSKELEDLRLLMKAFKGKLSVAEIRARLLEEDQTKGKKELIAVRRELRDLLLAHDLLSRRITLSAAELEAAKKALASLKGERLLLLNQARLLRDAADHRFAGIALTGKHVLFLVDMSGSMELIDENTPDPDKWPLVCETVAKIMRSLPELKSYQVLLFSDKVRYPFGKPGKWLEYDPRVTPAGTFKGLKAVKPVGETNMAAVFEEAFRFRPQGLDTIYVLSDGLPNAGPGIPPGQFSLSEAKKSEYLCKYMRNRLTYVWNRPTAGQPRVRINTIGFFFESPEVGAFLWAMAREHDGSFVGMSK